MVEQTDLRQEIEALAVKAMVEDLSSEAGFERSLGVLADAVRGIRERARAGGRGDLETIASGLSETLGSATPAAREDVSRALEAGVAALQQGLENPAAPPSAPAQAANSLAQDPELLADFVLESREHLAAIESRSLELEQNPGNAEAFARFIP